jgi:hypothetical protein
MERGGMVLTGEDWRTRRKTPPHSTLFTTNPKWMDPGLVRWDLGDWPPDVKKKINLELLLKIQFVPRSKHTALVMKTSQLML